MKKSVVVAGVVASVALMVSASPASAARSKDPCRTLKTSEIAAVFGGASVDDGQRADPTRVTPVCRWAVSASANLPEGAVFVYRAKGSKAAYDALKKDSNTERVVGLKNGLYSPARHFVALLKGDALITVQGEFLDDNLSNIDVKDQLVQLAKKAAPRG
jgi:hypothetical protein